MFNRHVNKYLSSYIDEQLANTQKQKVDRHLARCKACQDELARLRLLADKLQAWQAPALGKDFDASLKNKILRREIQGGKVKMKSKSLAFVIPSSALALLLMVAVLSQTYFKKGFDGRLRSTPDDIGEHYSMGIAGDTRKNEKAWNGQYERYYLASGREQIKKGPLSGSAILLGSGRGKNSVSQEIGYAGINEAENGENHVSQLGYEALASVDSARKMIVGNIAGTSAQIAGYRDDKAALERSAYQPPPGPATLTNQPDVGSVIVIQPVITATSEGEKIIRTGEITLEVENGQQTYQKAAKICQELGGYLGESGFYRDSEGRESGNVVMRIPKDKFLAAMDTLGALGKVITMNSSSQDVGREYKDLKQQLDITMVVYNKMFEALNKKQVNIPEAIRMESELTPVLRKIENLKAKLEYLDNLVSYTTVKLSFYESKVSTKALSESKLLIKKTMLESAINSVKLIATSIPVALFLGVLAVLLFGLSVVVRNWIVYLFKRK